MSRDQRLRTVSELEFRYGRSSHFAKSHSFEAERMEDLRHEIRSSPFYPEQLLAPVSVHALFPPAEFELDLYLHPASNGRRSLYASVGYRPTVADLERLIADGLKTLYVPREQIGAFNENLERLLSSDVELAAAARFEIAKEAAKGNFAAAWCRASSDSLIASASHLSERVIEACRSADETSGLLSSMLAHDGSTFSHVTNVCAYGVLLAMNLGVSDERTLGEIGVGGLLHDIGKRFIVTDILRKPGRLTPEERRVIEQHPVKGFEELCRRSDMTQGQLSMVYQHHERIDGSGYPVRAVASEIHWMAKLCAVVDVFDALTGRRAYRAPARIDDALEYLTQRSGTLFDAEMVRCWKSVFSTQATVLS
jgi:HD-GYP domain-containing protein (c-di-GMP phosphodiesterase class II)